ncbi:signal transduction histidine kinase [Catenuloplanes indicus]|uniref:histidine kinase n=1 Tax=Catenuloplanes indicus TaxID=137267 RepID=A0AAE3W346_9ACTN|nr:signal transduction histidine kinase [Catenuloplanes indicus]
MRWPRFSIRTRLTLSYAALFAATGGLLLPVSHLVAYRSLSSADAGLYARVSALAAVPGAAAMPVQGAEPTGPVTGPGETWAPDVYAAIDQARAEALNAMLVQSGVVFAVATATALVLCWFVASRALRPLRTITAAAERLSHETLEDRIVASGPRDELFTLAQTFNTMLDRLHRSFQAQKLFVANASHELRTPLTVIQAAAERALSRPHRDEADYRKALTTVVTAAHRSERLLSGLLTLARVRQQPAVPHRADLAVVVAEGVRAATGPAIRADLAPAPLAADPVLAELLVRNLVENAVRYNVDGGTVWVRTRADGDEVVLEVANTGPEVPADTVPLLRRAFQRGGRRTGGPDGSGLGLAIVDAIVDAHGGQWAAVPRAGGGLTVTVRLPGGG